MTEKRRNPNRKEATMGFTREKRKKVQSLLFLLFRFVLICIVSDKDYVPPANREEELQRQEEEEADDISIAIEQECCGRNEDDDDESRTDSVLYAGCNEAAQKTETAPSSSNFMDFLMQMSDED